MRFSGRNGAHCWKELAELANLAFYNPLFFTSRPLLPSPVHRQTPEDIRVISLRSERGKHLYVYTQGTEGTFGLELRAELWGLSGVPLPRINHSPGSFHSPWWLL